MPNETVSRKAGTRRELINMITIRQITFLGHVNRKEKIENLAMTEKLQGNMREIDKGLHL